jgi:hypothetical protein
MLTNSIVKLPLNLEGSSIQLVKKLREIYWFEWLREDKALWIIPVSKEQIEKDSGYTLVFAANFLSLRPNLILHQDGPSNRYEGRCIVAMIHKSTYDILGYSNEDYYDEWRSHEGEDYVEEASFVGSPVRLG